MTQTDQQLTFDPPIGLGTGSLSGETCTTAVETALEAGYRHIDTARVYENEAAIGEALGRSKVDIEEITVATKVHSRNLSPEGVRESARLSADRLGVDTIDLLYVHWPAHTYEPKATLDAFADLRERGLVHHIGLCNVTVDILRESIDAVDAPIEAVQFEYHPLWRQEEVRTYAQESDIAVVAYSPLAKGNAVSLPEVRTVAKRHDATPAQVCLAWLLARGIFPIPESEGPHLSENLAARSLSLSEDDVAAIDAVDHRERMVDYPFAPWN